MVIIRGKKKKRVQHSGWVTVSVLSAVFTLTEKVTFLVPDCELFVSALAFVPVV